MGIPYPANPFGVCRHGNEIIVTNTRRFRAALSQYDAIHLAAWLVTLCDVEDKKEFINILQRMTEN